MSETSQVASETTPCRGHRWFEPVAPSLVIAVMAFANLVYRVVISRPGYFWQDDFYITAWAKYNPFGPDYLFLPFSDHFQPLGFALAWFSQRSYPIPYEVGRLAKVATTAAALFGVGTFLRSPSPWSNIAVATSMVAAYPVVLLAIGFLQPWETREIRQALAAHPLGRRLFGSYRAPQA